MIVKKIKHTVNDKPKDWQISDLVDYIRNPDISNKGEKIAHAGGLNFLARTHAGQKLEMISLARETVRSKMPSRITYFHGRRENSRPESRWTNWWNFFSGKWDWRAIRQSTGCIAIPEIIMFISR